ncbi:unnamed protein product [Effrenium voratum]|nr:unnamed protein product [Effrenium voratum]
MTIWASTFQGPSMDYQWFDRFLVTSESQEIADIRVGRVPEGANRSHFGRWDFRQLDIRIRSTRLRRRAQQLFSSPDGQVKVAVGARVVDAPRVRSSPLMEFVMVESASISFMVHASHAGSEFPGDPEKQVKYTHLDFVNLETAGMEHFQGILPQLWGIKVRSPEVEQMLVPPSQRKDLERVVCDSA